MFKFFLLVYSLASTLCIASDLFVTPTGTGSSCTQATPCSLSQALSAVNDNDNIYFGAGNYNGSGNAVISLDKAVNLIGGWDSLTATPPKTNPQSYFSTIDAEGSRRGIYIDGSFSMSITGLRVFDGNASGLGGYSYAGSEYDAGSGIYIKSATINLSNSEIFENKAKSIYGGGIYLEDSDTQLHDNVIRNNIAYSGGALYTFYGSPVIKNNIIKFNTTDGNGGGIFCFSSSVHIENNLISENNSSRNGGGIMLASLSAAEVVNNTIIKNHADSVGGGFFLWYADGAFVNNIIADNDIGSSFGTEIWMGASETTFAFTTFAQSTNGASNAIYIGDAGSSHSNIKLSNTILAKYVTGVLIDTDSIVDINATLWWEVDTNTSGDGTINIGVAGIAGNPAFIDTNNGDFHIGVSSAAIDAGIDVGVTIDIDKDSRPKLGNYDIGADEYNGVVLVPIYYLILN